MEIVAVEDAQRVGIRKSKVTLRGVDGRKRNLQTYRSSALDPYDLWCMTSSREARRLLPEEVIELRNNPSQREKVVDLYAKMISGSGSTPMTSLVSITKGIDDILTREMGKMPGNEFAAARRLISRKDIESAKALSDALGIKRDTVFPSSREASVKMAQEIAKANSGASTTIIPDQLSPEDKMRIVQAELLSEAVKVSSLSQPEHAAQKRYAEQIEGNLPALSRVEARLRPEEGKRENISRLSSEEIRVLAKVMTGLAREIDKDQPPRRLAIVHAAPGGKVDIFTKDGPHQNVPVAPREDGSDRQSHRSHLVWVKMSNRAAGFRVTMEGTDPLDPKELAELGSTEEGRAELAGVARETIMFSPHRDQIMDRVAKQVDGLMDSHVSQGEKLFEAARTEAQELNKMKEADTLRDAVSEVLSKKAPDTWSWTDFLSDEDLNKDPLREDPVSAFLIERDKFLHSSAELDRHHEVLKRREAEQQEAVARAERNLTGSTDAILALSMGTKDGWSAIGGGKNASSSFDDVIEKGAHAQPQIAATRMLWDNISTDLPQIDSTGVQERIAARLSVQGPSQEKDETADWGYLVSCKANATRGGTPYLEVEMETAKGAIEGVLFGEAMKQFGGEEREDTLVKFRIGKETGLGVPSIKDMSVPGTDAIAKAIENGELDREDAVTALRRGLRRENSHGILVFGRSAQDDVRVSSRNLVTIARDAFERDISPLEDVKKLGGLLSEMEPDFRQQRTFAEILRGSPSPAERLDITTAKVSEKTPTLRDDLRILRDTVADDVAERDQLESKLKAQMTVLDLYQSAAGSVSEEAEEQGSVADQGLFASRKRDLMRRFSGLNASEATARGAMASNAEAGSYDATVVSGAGTALDTVLPMANITVTQIAQARAGERNPDEVIDTLEKARASLMRIHQAELPERKKETAPVKEQSRSRNPIDAEIDAATEMVRSQALTIDTGVIWATKEGFGVAIPTGDGVRVARSGPDGIEVALASDWIAARDFASKDWAKYPPKIDGARIMGQLQELSGQGIDVLAHGEMSQATSRASSFVKLTELATGKREITYSAATSAMPGEPSEAIGMATALAEIAAKEGAHYNASVRSRVSGALLVARRRSMEIVANKGTDQMIKSATAALRAASRADPENIELNVASRLAESSNRAPRSADRMKEDAMINQPSSGRDLADI